MRDQCPDACDNGAMNPWLIGAPLALTAGAALTTYGAVNPRSQLFGSTMWQTSSAQKLAITFDDGPNPKITPDLLQLLESYGARATFFVVGRFVSECTDLVREIAERGHIVGNHTATHPNLFLRAPGEARDELRRCNEAIANATGRQPEWFRPPFGFRNPWTVSTATALGLRTVMWTELPGDWRGKPQEWLIERMKNIRKRAAEATIQNAEHSHGDILCLHDGDFRFLDGDRSATLRALRYWLPRWRDVGLEFVTIDEAVKPTA
jgi:peptidoglycan-N-acetylglucosamine deacetylase